MRIRRYLNGKLVSDQDEERVPGLGDRIENAIGKIPGVKKLPCYDKDGNLKPESGCGKRKKKLNELGEKIMAKLSPPPNEKDHPGDGKQEQERP